MNENLSGFFSYTATKVLVVILAAIVFNYLIKFIIRKLFSVKNEANIRNRHLVQKSRETAKRIVLSMIKIMVWVSAILVSFSLMHIDTSAILAGASFFGLIIGLGTKTLIQAVVTGFFLVTDGNISIGDYVKINDFKGIVEDVELRNITLISATGELCIIPVEKIKTITNYSLNDKDVLISFTLSFDNEFMNIMNVLNKTLKEMSTYVDTSTDLYVSGFNITEAGYEVRVACKAVAGTHIEVSSLIKNEITKAFKTEGVVFAQPGK